MTHYIIGIPPSRVLFPPIYTYKRCVIIWANKKSWQRKDLFCRHCNIISQQIVNPSQHKVSFKVHKYISTFFQSITTTHDYKEIPNHITRTCHQIIFEITRTFHHFLEINHYNTLLNVHYFYWGISVVKSLCHLQKSSFQPHITPNKRS